MKRDKELQRLLLLQLRDGVEPTELKNYPEPEKVYNSALLINDGFVVGDTIRGGDGQYVSTIITELTSSGHDFLEKNKQQSQIKEMVKGTFHQHERELLKETLMGLTPSELTPRAVRAFVVRYQLVRLILRRLGHDVDAFAVIAGLAAYLYPSQSNSKSGLPPVVESAIQSVVGELEDISKK